MKWGFETWLITDCYMRVWRFSIAHVEGTSRKVIPHWDLPTDLVSDIVYNTFDTVGALCGEPARDLIEIYDALTGADLGETLPQPTSDPRLLLRGFEDELNRVLREAVEAGVLKFERHEVPWPFPEVEEKENDTKKHEPTKEDSAHFLADVVDEAGEVSWSRTFWASFPNQIHWTRTDGAYLNRNLVPYDAHAHPESNSANSQTISDDVNIFDDRVQPDADRSLISVNWGRARCGIPWRGPIRRP